VKAAAPAVPGYQVFAFHAIKEMLGVMPTARRNKQVAIAMDEVQGLG